MLTNKLLAVKIENLYKEYRLGVIGYGSLQEDLQSWWARIKGVPDPNSVIDYNFKEKNNHKGSNRILALNNIDLAVYQGERLGIIGKNGAGKTTLLKILSSIASPTKGIIRIRGRIASLIAVGTGFHGELTGRENIYLNGAILGLKKIEIDQRFDAIVEFSGIKKFIDTPVKRYSSGMSVRLGFSVAAHLDPDVLIVDEVLAVGDIEFQSKAIGAMKDTSESKDRTVIFVSHNMDTIRRICDRCIILDDGKIRFDGNTDEAITEYKKINHSFISADYRSSSSMIFSDKPDLLFQILNISIKDSSKIDEINFSIFEPIFINLEYIIRDSIPNLMVNIAVFNDDGLIISSNVNDKPHSTNSGIKKGKYKASIKIPSLLLKPGAYVLFSSIGIADIGGHSPKPGLKFNIYSNNSGLNLTTFGSRAGKVLFPARWEIEHKDL
ncbi:MAG: hypothetical protein CMG74_02715 [Candidatus Marinimicrobia bacterium]|nr:hypothetical protein [Candidatus Neomarinimicrobiota bacterium]